MKHTGETMNGGGVATEFAFSAMREACTAMNSDRVAMNRDGIAMESALSAMRSDRAAMNRERPAMNSDSVATEFLFSTMRGACAAMNSDGVAMNRERTAMNFADESMWNFLWKEQFANDIIMYHEKFFKRRKTPGTEAPANRTRS